MFRQQEIVERLTRLEERLVRIEAALTQQADAPELRRSLDRKHDQLDALSRQGLHLVELLDAARQEIERLKSGGS